jgi:hypothetical protein
MGLQKSPQSIRYNCAAEMVPNGARHAYKWQMVPTANGAQMVPGTNGKWCQQMVPGMLI